MPTINLSTLDGADGFRLAGAAGLDQSGYSVRNAGDLNGDGFDDVIVGAFAADPNGEDSGASYVVFGKASGFAASIDLGLLNGADGFRLDGVNPGDETGRSVASAGDLNGDGFDDLIVGAPNADANAAYDAGAAYVVFGKSAPFNAIVTLGALNGADGFALIGIDAGDNVGKSVSGVGDVNGDGLDDVLIGASGATANGKVGAGASYVVFGRTTGFDAAIDLASLDGSNGFRLNGVSQSDTSGISVSGAGDVNGDDIDDLIIGAFAADPDSRSGAGASYVVFGRETGFDAAFNLASLNGSNGFRLDGVHSNDASGVSVGGAGDVNGDGFADMIVGAFGADPFLAASAGSTYVVFGKAGGFAPTQKLDHLDGTNGFRLDGDDAGDQSGFAVDGAGDVNGDGFDDLIVGAFKADPSGKVDAGESYVVFGKAGGFAANLDLGILGFLDGFRLNGVGGRDVSGSAVSAAGDVNGDGFDDLMIGAFLADPYGTPYAGETYVLFGRNFTSSVTHSGTVDADTLTGNAGADIMVGGLGNDLLVGLGGADTLRGGGGNDILQISDAGYRRIDGGAGFDKLRLVGADIAIDFTAPGSQMVSGIEAIQLNGANAYITLGRAAIANLSDDANRLTVTGIAGSGLTLSDPDWQMTVIGGNTLLFTKNAVELTVSANVRVSLSPTATVEASAANLAFANLNYAPRLTVLATPALSIAADVNVAIDTSTWFTDPDTGDSLTITATGLPDGLTLNGTVITGTVALANIGVHTVSVTATDDARATAVSTIQLSIDDVNFAPILTGFAPATLAIDEGVAAAIDVTGWFADPDIGDALTFSATGLPAGLSLNGGLLSGTVAIDGVGAHTIKITATDAAGAKVASNLDLTVNGAIVFVPLDPRLWFAENADISIDLATLFTDSDGDVLTFTLTGLPDGMSFDAETGLITGLTNVGDHPIDVIATDPFGFVLSQTITLGVYSADALLGTAGADFLASGAFITELFGDAGDDLLVGETASERMFGQAGDDVLVGRGGDDYLEGGPGNDRLNGGDGADIMIGGAGNDIYTVDNLGDVIIELENEGIDRVNAYVDYTNFAGVEYLAAKYADRGLQLHGNDARDIITGSAVINSPDHIWGEGGDDKIVGLTGNDVIDGGLGTDRIFGNSGDDTISGGAGNDRMTGQFGDDTFLFAPGDGQDRITDFNSLGHDTIDLTAFAIADFSTLLTHFQTALSGALINLGPDTILLEGINSANLSAADFLL